MYKKIAEDLKEAEKVLIELSAEIQSLGYTELENQKDYFPEYTAAKQKLRKTRQGLRKLAHRTVSDVTDLLVLLTALYKSKEPVLLKVSLDKMKALMIETLKTLNEAFDDYNSAQEKMENLNASIKKTNILLGEVLAANEPSPCSKLNPNSTGYEYFVYHANCITPRKFWDAFYPSIPKLRRISNKMKTQGTQFDKTIIKAIDILTEEIELITKWSNNAEIVNKNLDSLSEEYVKEISAIRTIFVSGLENLQKSALDFLAQPIDILA